MEIQRLDSEVVDQIAAGEVVERPAHLVKELVENSIDAGSTEIDVEFEQGGRYVLVTDNGMGIKGSELELALARHATSKIRHSSDLWSLNSFGFRGEALATISAVCRLSITSRIEGSDNAQRMMSAFGEKSDVVKVGGSQGTTIEVSELFSNVPARLKFLKSDVAESGAIKDVLKALALSNHKVSFRLRSKGKLVYYWPAMESLKKRVEQILGQDKMYIGEAERNGIKAYVVFGSPNNTFRTRKNIWLFVQRRWVQDRSLQAAVLEAHRSLLMHGEFPICSVWVECSPQEIDVNIHPTKSQIKFRDGQSAFRAVQGALRESLEKAPWLEDVLGEGLGVKPYSPLPKKTEQQESSLEFRAQEFERTQFAQKEFSTTQGLSEKQSEGGSMDPSVESSVDFSVKSSVEYPMEKTHRNQSPPLVSQGGGTQKAYWSDLQVLGQANLTYIVAQSRRGLVLVDQHAAHERVAFESLMAAWKGGDVDVQEFLFPLTIDLPEDQVEALFTQKEALAKLGIHIEAMGPATVGVKGGPVLIKDGPLAKTISQLSHKILDEGGSFLMEKVIIDTCATLACHSVIRAGQALSREEMQSLLEQMDLFPTSSFCPHGRPVYVEYPFQEMERDFGRLV